MRDGTQFALLANQRGWIAACHRGQIPTHWNAGEAQEHCRAVLDWLSANYPFARDSIYMVGGSMGGAAGQVWHNNNCGSEDYLIAATVGGSHILDCQLRQEQYLAGSDTNRSMRSLFGGLPSESDSIAFEYHRASAIFLADTTQSMHFNSLHLPVWNTWGMNDFEWTAYGYPALTWDTLRRADGADTTVTYCSGIDGHGITVIPQDTVMQWFSGFSANRYPDRLSINADENGDYYWTSATLVDTNWTFGRFGAVKDSALRRLDLTLINNVESLTVNFTFPWSEFDSLVCQWRQLDSAISGILAMLDSVPEPWDIVFRSGGDAMHTYLLGQLVLSIPENTADFTIYFEPLSTGSDRLALPQDIRLVSAYPNPFNSSTRLLIESAVPMETRLLIHDILGRLVATKDVELRTGQQQILFDASGLATGTYFVGLRDSGEPPLRILLLR